MCASLPPPQNSSLLVRPLHSIRSTHFTHSPTLPFTLLTPHYPVCSLHSTYFTLPTLSTLFTPLPHHFPTTSPPLSFDLPEKAAFEWKKLKEKRDAYIQRLHGIYHNNLAKDKVQEMVHPFNFSCFSLSLLYHPHSHFHYLSLSLCVSLPTSSLLSAPLSSA